MAIRVREEGDSTGASDSSSPLVIRRDWEHRVPSAEALCDNVHCRALGMRRHGGSATGTQCAFSSYDVLLLSA